MSFKINISAKEQKAIDIILAVSNLEDDCSAVWCQPSDLIENGFSRHEAAGLWSSLLDKGLIEEDEKRPASEGGDLFLLCWDVLPRWKQIEINEQDGCDRPITSNFGELSPR